MRQLVQRFAQQVTMLACVQRHIVAIGLDPGVAVLPGRFGQVDDRFQGFDLTEEELVFAVGVGPMPEESAGRRRDVGVLGVPPEGDALPKPVAGLVLCASSFPPLRF